MTATSRAVAEPRSSVDLAGYARLAFGLRRLLGIDLDQYRPAQMWRRVNGFAISHGLANSDALLVACRQRPELLAGLRDMLTINVSEFFRDPDAWQRLAKRIGGELSADRGFRAWSAGCSLGFEPYSLAMLATELGPDTPIRIVATDIDQSALDVARAGHYDLARQGGLSPSRRDRFLAADGPGWTFRPEVRSMIRFGRHDLLEAPVSVRTFDLVICRNVVIYFTEEAKATVHRRLADALRPGGVLFVGATEAILRPSRFGLSADGPGLYVRTD